MKVIEDIAPEERAMPLNPLTIPKLELKANIGQSQLTFEEGTRV